MSTEEIHPVIVEAVSHYVQDIDSLFLIYQKYLACLRGAMITSVNENLNIQERRRLFQQKEESFHVIDDECVGVNPFFNTFKKVIEARGPQTLTVGEGEYTFQCVFHFRFVTFVNEADRNPEIEIRAVLIQ